MLWRKRRQVNESRRVGGISKGSLAKYRRLHKQYGRECKRRRRLEIYTFLVLVIYGEWTNVFADLKSQIFLGFSNAPGKLATSAFSYMQTIAPYPRVAGPAIALEHGNCGNPIATRCSILVGVTFRCCGA